MTELKDILLTAPDTMLDASMKPLLQNWSSPPTALQVLEVLDKCIFSSLANGAVIIVLRGEYELRLKEEKTTHDELVERAVWRSNP